MPCPEDRNKRDSGTPTQSNWRWGLLFAFAFVLPWALAIGSANVLEAWLPGRVATEHWRNFSSACFVAGGAFAAILLVRIPGHHAFRLILAILVLIGGVWLACMFQLRSNCGDESECIGTVERTQVASCQ